MWVRLPPALQVLKSKRSIMIKVETTKVYVWGTSSDVDLGVEEFGFKIHSNLVPHCFNFLKQYHPKDFASDWSQPEN